MSRQKRYPARVGRAGELFPELVDVLLGGWGATHRHAEDPFRIFDLSGDDMRRIWEQHRETLLAEATRRGLGRPVFVEWMAGEAFDPGLDWGLASAALHNTAPPDWALPWWTAERLQALGAHMRNCARGDVVALRAHRGLFRHVQVLCGRRLPLNPIDQYALAVVEGPGDAARSSDD